MNVGERIKELRINHDMTQEYVGNYIEVTKQTLYKYENGVVTNIPSDKIEKLAKLFNVSPAYLMGWDSNVTPIEYNQEKFVTINIYGTVPAGIPIEAVENVVGKTEIPESWLKGNNRYIGLEVKGDSMYPKYFEGDTIIVKLQNTCESGQDAVVYVNGFDATLKTVVIDERSITLRPYNREYPEKKYAKGEDQITILGVVKELRRHVSC